jgi:hypothetical protein
MRGRLLALSIAAFAGLCCFSIGCDFNEYEAQIINDDGFAVSVNIRCQHIQCGGEISTIDLAPGKSYWLTLYTPTNDLLSFTSAAGRFLGCRSLVTNKRMQGLKVYSSSANGC